MSVVVIGSKAFNELGLETINRKQHDIDIISSFSDGLEYSKSILGNNVSITIHKRNLFVVRDKTDKSSLIVEILFPSKSNKLIFDYVIKNHSKVVGDIYYPTLDLLYTMKMSHRFKKTTSFEFLKTMSDIKMMEKYGASISNNELKNIFEVRQKEVLSYKHPNLKQTKNEFFTDDVPYVYDHDTIHDAVKNLNKPAYQFFKPDSNEVYCSKELFDNCDEQIKLLSVYEESCVLALERSIIPFSITDEDKIKNRFEYALQKVCTSITSGWFREYSYNHYEEVKSMYNLDFYNNFLIGLKNGTVKCV